MGIADKYEGLPDEQLMKLYTTGESQALGALYDRYHLRLVRYFHRMLWQDEEKAADFMQELFLKLANQPELYDPSRSFKTWLFSVAHNMCKNEYKKQEIRTRVHEELKHDGARLSEADAGYRYDMEQFSRALEKEVEELGEPHKSIFHLRFRENLQVKEIAEILEVSEGTVKSRIFYALRKLSEKLRAFDPKLQAYGTR